MVLHEMATAMCREPAIERSRPGIDPSLLYAGPSDLVLDHRLGSLDKIALLGVWRDDLTLRLTARSEGMGGIDEGLADTLARVRSALARLQRSGRSIGPAPRPRDGIGRHPHSVIGMRWSTASPESPVSHHHQGGQR
jgi:hypothetical protein